MSTNDVPGANPANRDQLAMGCWAEHNDGSLIVVESTEANRVVYSMFDLSKSPVIEYRDAMPEADFKKTFTRDTKGSGIRTILWTWHDKTPFPWDRVIKSGATDGGRLASADDILSAAERVAESLRLRGAAVARDLRHRQETVVEKSRTIFDKVSRAIGELRK